MPSQVKAEWAEWEEEDTAMAVRLHLQVRPAEVLAHQEAVLAHRAAVLAHQAEVLVHPAEVLARQAAAVHQAEWADTDPEEWEVSAAWAAWAASATEQARILRTEREWAT